MLATIYAKSKHYPLYRVAWTVAGKRMMKGFPHYGEAKRHADGLVKDLAKGSQVTLLTPGQARDALAAIERLQSHYQKTGKRFSLLAGISAFCDALDRLGDRSMSEAVDGYLSNLARVKRVDIGQAVEDWIASRKSKTIAKEGKRPQLSAGYFYNLCMWAREFANTFPGHAVCDLTKDHLDKYIADHADVGPKSRNERRGVVRMFLSWCVKKDYLPPAHRLLEADGMTREDAEPEDIEIYTPGELRAMLDRASRPPKPAKEGEEPEADYRHLLPIIALVGLGGVRLQEAARLTWQDVWHVPGHVEIKAGKSKGRSRRLATMPANLGLWLEPYRDCSGPLWKNCMDHFHRAFERMLGELEIPVRRNALRHGFVSAHYALHADEGLTAKEAGNSPTMVHRHYKGLTTKEQGQAWFNVAPSQAENVITLASPAIKG